MNIFISIITHDGVWLVRDHATGIVASGWAYADAVAELRRLLAGRQAA